MNQLPPNFNLNDARDMDCDCGGKYTHIHKSHHLKTKKHQKYLNELEKKDDDIK